jgi:hypothetical protein
VYVCADALVRGSKVEHVRLATNKRYAAILASSPSVLTLLVH